MTRLPLERLLKSPPARLALGRFPSPVTSHPGLARELGFDSLIAKREDQNADALGGNKLRALEWILPAARKGIVTMGGFGSTYAATLSHYARANGQRAAVALFPQPWIAAVPATLGLTARTGAVFLASSRWTMPFALVRAWRHAASSGRPTWVPAGGASPLGVLGSVNAALEFVEQVERGEAARPDVIVVPVGSSGTVAGLLVGCWIAGWTVDVCGVRVSDAMFANHSRVIRLAAATCRVLRQAGLDVRPAAARLRVLTTFLGEGYGIPTPAAERARRRVESDGMSLELTYGAKAFAALGTLSDSYRAPCFWHTFDARVAAGTEDTPLLRTARAYAESLWPQPIST